MSQEVSFKGINDAGCKQDISEMSKKPRGGGVEVGSFGHYDFKTMLFGTFDCYKVFSIQLFVVPFQSILFSFSF